MSLELFSSNIDDAVSYAARTSAPELPSTFSSNFDDAWNRGLLTSQSVSGTNRKIEARSQLVDDAVAKTGDRTLASFISPTGDDSDFDGFNRRLAELGIAGVQPLSAEAIQARADDIGVRQLSESRSLAQRERTLGGAIGEFTGAAAASVTDPVNMIAFPLAAPQSLGILGTAMAWAAIGAGSQGVIEALNAESMERIQPGYRASDEPLMNILGAGGGAAVLGGGLKGLANLWTKAKTGDWPRTIRDAGNVVESEAQIAGTNPFVTPPAPESPPASTLRLVSAPEGGIYTPDQIKPNEKYFKALDADGNVTAEILIKIDGTTARIEDILNPNAIREEGVGTVGNKQLRALLSQFRQQHPEITELTGSRVSGSRMGGEYSLLGEPAEVSIRLKPLSPVEGEAAHRTALTKAIDDLASGRPVDVENIVSAEQFAARDAVIDPVIAAREAVAEAQQAARVAAEDALASGKPQPDLPFEQTAAQARAELSTADLTKGIQDIARLAGHDMPAEDAAKIAARVAQMNDPDKACALLDEVFVRPQTIADTLPVVDRPVKPVTDKASPDAVASLRDELTPAKIEEARVNPDMEETISRDLDKLMLERPDLEVPTGVTVDADGRTVPTTRKIESVINEADNRLAAAKEIEACVGPYPAEAAE